MALSIYLLLSLALLLRLCCFFQAVGGWVFQKDSPYVSMFNYFLNNFRESGYLDKFMKNHLEARRLESCETSSFQAIYFENVFMIFLLLFVGVLVSLLLLGIECIKWVQDIPKLFLRT